MQNISSTTPDRPEPSPGILTAFVDSFFGELMGATEAEVDAGASSAEGCKNDFLLDVYARPTDVSPLYAIEMATPTEVGVKATVLKYWPPDHLPDEFACEKRVVDHLFRETPGERRNIVFLQFCPPGRPFLPYVKEREKMVMTVPSFLSLLRVFRDGTFLNCELKMRDVRKTVEEGKELIRISPLLSFSGAGDVVLAGTLRESGHTLVLDTEWKYQDAERNSLVLKYTDLPMDYLPLDICPAAMAKVALEYNRFEELLGYKEGRPSKRIRQLAPPCRPRKDKTA